MTDTYKISEKIVEMFDRSQVAETCRDACIDKVFGWKRASHYAFEALKWKRKAWNAVKAVYPELDGKTITYNYGSDSVSIKDDSVPRRLNQ